MLLRGSLGACRLSPAGAVWSQTAMDSSQSVQKLHGAYGMMCWQVLYCKVFTFMQPDILILLS